MGSALGLVVRQRGSDGRACSSLGQGHSLLRVIVRIQAPPSWPCTPARPPLQITIEELNVLDKLPHYCPVCAYHEVRLAPALRHLLPLSVPSRALRRTICC